MALPVLVMTLPNLFAQLGWLSLFIPLVGLWLSRKFRERAWVISIYFPTVGLLLYFALWTILKIAAFGAIGGSDTMGVGIILPLLGAILLAVAVGLGLAFIARPRKGAWSLMSVLSALGVCAAIVLVCITRAGAIITGSYVEVTFALTNGQGDTLRHIPVQFKAYEAGLGARRYPLTSDETGRFTLKLRQGQAATVEIRAPFPPSGVLSGMPTYWTIDLHLEKSATTALEIRHFWQRSFGGRTLDESYLERVPIAEEVTIPVAIPAHSGLLNLRLQERISQAIRTFEVPPSSYKNWGFTCRNVEAIESIPWLMEVYRSSPGKRASVTDGLCQTAAILGRLERAFAEIHRRELSPREFNLNYLEGELKYEAVELGKWAGADGDDLIGGIQKARDKVAIQARLLGRFAIAKMGEKIDVIRILGELGLAARPLSAEFLQAIRANPPKDLLGIQTLGQVLWLITPEEERSATARLLFESDAPEIVLVGCESIRNRMESSGGSYALQRLQAVLPNAANNKIADRVRLYIDYFPKKK